jgi:hypothetical protein
MSEDIFGETMTTDYGLEFIVLSPQEWQSRKAGMDSYDVSIGNMHLQNYGFVILDAQYEQPIDNEYDLEEIENQLKNYARSSASPISLTETQLRNIIKKTITEALLRNV